VEIELAPIPAAADMLMNSNNFNFFSQIFTFSYLCFEFFFYFTSTNLKTLAGAAKKLRKGIQFLLFLYFSTWWKNDK
jgi:hypothetical protein